MIIASFMSNRTVRKLAAGHKDRFLPVLSYGFDAAMVGFLLSASFVTVLYYPYFWIQCALTASLYAAAKRKYTTKEAKTAQNGYPQKIYS
jgi:putative inorganic carbon (hco3(-)) transporter